MHHITRIENLESILKSKFLVARNFAKNNFIDTANNDIIEKRRSVNGKDLNDYVPFHNDHLQRKYGIPYNYIVCKKNGKANMIYLIFDTLKVVSLPHDDYLFYVYHPVSLYSKKCSCLGELQEKLSKEFSTLPRLSKSKIDFSSTQVKEYLMSEILVRHLVSLRYLSKIYVYNKETGLKVRLLLNKYNYQDISVVVNSNFYSRY